MIPTPMIVDIITVAVLVFSALRGRHRGLIKTLTGIIALILAFSLAGFLAKETTPYIADKYVSPYITSAVNYKTEELSESNTATSPDSAVDIFIKLGISEEIVGDAVSDFTDAMTKSFIKPIVAMTNSVAYKITYSVLFVIYFILSLLILLFLLKIVNLASKIPGINFINKTLGLILGLILGYLIVMVLSFILLKLGIGLTDELVSSTSVLKFIMNFSPAAIISNSKIL